VYNILSCLLVHVYWAIILSGNCRLPLAAGLFMVSFIYKDEMGFCSFLFVSLYLIQIHISEPISTEICTRLPLRLEEVVGYVWTHNIWPFSTSSVMSQCRILGTTWLPAQESLRQCYIRDLADDTCASSHPWYTNSRRQLRVRTASALHFG